MSLSLVIVVVLGNITQNKDDWPKLLDGRGVAKAVQHPLSHGVTRPQWHKY